MMKYLSLLLAILLFSPAQAGAQLPFGHTQDNRCSQVAGIFEFRRCGDALRLTDEGPEMPRSAAYPAAAIALEADRAGAGRMILRCRGREMEVLFAFDGHRMGNRGADREIVYRVDDEPARIIELSRSTDYSVLGLWRSFRSVPFIESLLAGRKLALEARNAAGEPLLLQIAIDNLRRRLPPIRKACGW